MCEVGAKTANVARHALVNAFRSVKPSKKKNGKEKGKAKQQQGSW